MAEFAQRVLMNEFKALSKETWTNIEVRRHPTLPRSGVADPQRSTVLTTVAVTERQRLRMERRPHRTQPRLTLLRRLLQGQNDLPPQLPSLTTRYVTPLDPDPTKHSLTLTQTSNSSAPSTTPTSTPTAACASPSCTPPATTRCPAN
jgi:hypothetical protein